MKRPPLSNSLPVAGLLVAFSFLTARSAAAQHPISTDRPGFLFSPALVPEGVLQVEAGTPLLFYDDEGGEEASLYSLPVQLRYGLSPSLELRVGAPVFNWLRADGVRDEEGVGDIEVGVKTPLPLPFDQDVAGIIGSVRLPTGDDAFSVDGAAPSVNAMASWTLAENLSFTGLAGITYIPLDGVGDPIVGSLAGLASRSLGAGWTGCVEAAWFPADNAEETAFVGLLATNVLSDRVQLDVSLDRGLTDESTDWIAGAGVSFYVGTK